MRDAAVGHNKPVLTASELSQTLKRTVEQSFGAVRGRGEISQAKGADELLAQVLDDGRRLVAVMGRMLGSAAARVRLARRGLTVAVCVAATLPAFTVALPASAQGEDPAQGKAPAPVLLDLATAKAELRRAANELTAGRTLAARGALDGLVGQFERLGDRRNYAMALALAGDAAMRLGHLEGARTRLEAALAVYRELREIEGEAMALGSLGDVHERAEQPDAARQAYAQEMALWRRLGDDSGTAAALLSTGKLEKSIGHYREAEDALRRAISLFRKARNLRGEAGATLGLAELQAAGVNYRAAALTFAQARALFVQAGDVKGEAWAAMTFGRQLATVARFDDAVRHLREAAGIYRDLEQPRAREFLLVDIAKLEEKRGDAAGAADAYAQLRGLAAESGDSELGCFALNGLAHALAKQRGVG